MERKQNKYPRIKICCISSLAEARQARALGADILGLVGSMPSGPGVIQDDMIAEIAIDTPSSIRTFLLTSETTARGVITHYNKVKTTSIQLVDTLPLQAYPQIRQRLPTVELVQVIHVLGKGSVDEALTVAPMVDFLLLDSGNPNLSIKELGGTGRTHDWAISRQIVEQSSVPVFLAGGLNADNVREAIERVQPYGLDLCSGVRTNNQLDVEKLKVFVNVVRDVTK